jgi:hypothetical protein
LIDSAERFYELKLLTLFGRFGLEKMIEVILPLLMVWLGYVDWIHQYLGIVHGAPSDKTAMVAESGKLVLLNIAVDGLLDVEVVIGHRDICETATNYIIAFTYKVIKECLFRILHSNVGLWRC